MDRNAASGPRPRPGILEIEVYQGGESSVPGLNRVFKLSSNETPLGPSPLALEAFHGTAGGLAAYPDGSAADLKAAIAKVHGLEAERILVGNGSDELLALLAQAYLSPGDEAITTEYSFLIYRIATQAANARPILTPERNFKVDVDAILAALSPRTGVVFLANPSNPTGTYLNRLEIERLHAGLPPDVLLVLDGAYAEYATQADFHAGEELVRRFSNVVMTRTFSKIYGLAGLRLGWAYAPPAIVDVINRIRPPFNASAAAQAAGIAAVRDQAHIGAARKHNAQWRAWLEREIAALGIAVVPSAANFLLLDCTALGPGAGAAVNDALKRKGIILRWLASYGLPEALRISIGSEEANKAAVAALAEFVKSWKP